MIASGVRFVTQNGIYDWGWLRADGGIVMPPSDRLEEIGALATMIDENQFTYSLDALCARYGLPGKDETLLEQAIEAAGFARSEVNAKNTSGNCRRAMSALRRDRRGEHARTVRDARPDPRSGEDTRRLSARSRPAADGAGDLRLRRLALQRGSGQGGSVHVCWCGGPSETEVEAVAEKHAHRGLSLLLLRDEPCTRCGEPTPPLDGRVICVRCAPVLWECGGTERGR